MKPLTVHSARDGGRLEIQPVHGDRWVVSLSLPYLSASTEVDAFALDGENTLGILFRRIADDWRGWDGERGWASLEGDFRLAATHDGLGHIALVVRLRSGPEPDRWRVEGTIWLEPGQLDALAREAAAF